MRRTDVEAALFYRGMVEYVEMLEGLIGDMSVFLANVPDLDIAYCDQLDWREKRDVLQQRAKELLGQAQEGETDASS